MFLKDTNQILILMAAVGQWKVPDWQQKGTIASWCIIKGWHVSELQIPAILSACARRSSFRTSKPWLPSANPISRQDHFWRAIPETGLIPASQFRWTDGNDFEPLQTWADSSSWPIFQPWRFPWTSRCLLGRRSPSSGGWAGFTIAAWCLHGDCCWADAALTVPTLLSQCQHCSHNSNTALTIPTLLSHFSHNSSQSWYAGTVSQ